MSYNIKIIFISIILSFIHSKIDYYQCVNGKRKIKLEDGSIKEYNCIDCPEGEYTIYNNKTTPFICKSCEEGTSNYGKNIIINSFSKSLMSQYNFISYSECNFKDNITDICPEWKINPLSLRVDYIENVTNLTSVFTINQYYMNDGELIIKYINYNGGIDKYFKIYINNKLIYKDDSEHSVIKTKTFFINKGINIIKFEYTIDNNLYSKGKKYDDISYLEIFEIQMKKAETSSLNCQKYDPLKILNDTIHNSCDYYIGKCSNDSICTFRFYTEEKNEYCNYLEGTQNITYNKIPWGVCKEIISPLDDEVECEHCSYGQYILINGEDESKCEYCDGDNYNNKIINDEKYCDKICDLADNKKQLNKILYITNFEDHSEYKFNNLNITLTIGYIEVNYEKFNEKEDCHIFIEINDFNNENNKINKTIELINPDENSVLLSYYKFKIPFPKGEYNVTIKGENLKLNKLSITGTEYGGNYECVDKLNIEEETCPNENEHYYPIQKCKRCINGTIIDQNKECIFIEQFIDNKFILENNLLYNIIFLSSYNYISERENYFLSFNPTYPLMYYINKIDNNTVIIGKELYKVKLVKGINNRGIILSYLSVDNDQIYITNIFLKCNKTNSEDEENILLKNITIDNDIIYYFFILETNKTCPYCLDSEISYKEDNSKCIDNKQLVNITIKEESLCVIKPYDNSTDSKLINETSIMLKFNTSDEEDKLLLSYYNIDEKIPIKYEKDDDEINTLYQKNITCEYKRKSITEMGTGVLILIIIAGVFGLIVIGVIIWKIIDNNKMNKYKERKNESLMELAHADIKKEGEDRDEKTSLLKEV